MQYAAAMKNSTAAGQVRPAGSYRWLAALLLGAWFLYLLISPTLGFAWIESWHNEQRAAQVVLLAVTAFALAAMALDPAGRGQVPRVSWIVFAVFALGLLSAGFARYRDAAYAELALNGLLLGLALLSAGVHAGAPELSRRLLRWAALLLLAAYVAGVCVRYAAAISEQQAMDLSVLLLGYANPRFPSALHAILVPLVATLSLDPAERPLLRRLAFAVLVGIWAINIALGTRALAFAYVLALPALWMLGAGRGLWPLARRLALTALAGAALYALAFQVLPAWLGAGEAIAQRPIEKLLSGSNRHLLLASGWDAIRSAPWLGIGPMQFAAIPGVWSAHPHNWVLQLASEWGLPAAALSLYGIAGLLRTARRKLRESVADTPDRIAVLLASLIALVYGMVDGNLVMPVSQSAAAILFGVLLGDGCQAGAQGRFSGGPVSMAANLALAAGLVLASAQLGVFTASTLDAAMAKEDAHRYFARTVIWPRFWSDGTLPIGEVPPRPDPHAGASPSR